MFKFWVVDTKATMSPKSSINFEGYEGYYFGRSIVPANSSEDAIKELTDTLKNDYIEVVEVISIVEFNSKDWDSDHDDLFNTIELYEISKASNSINLGSFVSEETLKEW